MLEGTAFAMRDVVDRLDALGVPTNPAAHHGRRRAERVWCQIRADLTGRPADVLGDTDASAIGAAMLAAVAAGGMPDIETASPRCCALDARGSCPAPPVYENAYQRYREAFTALEPLWALPS